MRYGIKEILQMEVAPALGCTEPVAIALGAAAARALAPDDELGSLQVRVDPNIYKNGMAVAIPGTDGLQGLDMAAALGYAAGDAARRLEVLDPVDRPAVERARRMVADGKVAVRLLSDRRGLYIHTVVRGRRHRAESVIEGLHDNIVSLALDGRPVELPAGDRPGGAAGSLGELEAWLKGLSLEQLLEMVGDLDDEDLAFLQEGIDFNRRLAEHGLKQGSGMGVGRTLERLVRQRLLQRDMMSAARILASGAADARMAGVKLPAMSSAGSGNHGLTAILPIVAVREYVTVDDRTLLEAVALSHVVTGYIKAHTGRLSAVCGCSVAAGAGAAAGITYLLGGNLAHIAGAIKNLIMDLAGVICDGAKASCALKLSTAAGTAAQAALFALQGVSVSPAEGIAGHGAEGTMINVGTLTTEGMIATDRTILEIMLAKAFPDQTPETAT